VQSSQPIRARIANFQTAFNALSVRRQKYFVWRPRFSHPPRDFWRRAVDQPVHDKGEKMKKKLFALSGVFMIVLVVAGLCATRAINLNDAQQTVDPAATSPGRGMSMRQMVEESSSIVIGQCAETRSKWVGRSLVTEATISVDEALKGDAAPGTQMTVEWPGGVDHNRKVAMTVVDAPHISPGEKVFLFLFRPDDGANSYSVMGFAQGKFSVGQANDGEEVVTRDMSSAPLQKGAGMTRGNFQAIPLSKLKEWVKAVSSGN